MFKAFHSGRTALAILVALTASAPAAITQKQDLKSPGDFTAIEDDAERSAALFEEMGKVLQHPRCLNCHPVDNKPRQGDDMKMHEPPVVRGAHDEGAPGMQCQSCHGKENVAFATGEGSVPGHEPWHLAPHTTGWIGLSLRQICEQLKDPERNGGRTLAEIHEHNAKDGLVGWGWHPGEGRESAPGSQKIFGELTKAWIDTGARCPPG